MYAIHRERRILTAQTSSADVLTRSQFLDDILSNVYMASHDQRHVDEIYRSVRNIRDRMSAWQATIPPEILLDPNNLPAICPPPHIAHFK